MKIVLYFALFAVLAIAVSAEENKTALVNAIPRDRAFPIAENVTFAKVVKPRIVGGYEVTPEERRALKYQVCLHFDQKFLCGGSIISPRVVITAGHCVFGMHDAYVFMGLVDKTDMYSDYIQKQQVFSNNWKAHSYYNNDNLDYDIAIINLPKPAIFGEFVGSIPVECNNNLHQDESAIISGWGRHSDDDNSKTTILRAAEVKIANPDVCTRTFARKITDYMVCVSAENTVGTCQGDSGGPIVAGGKLIGATSFGAPGCKHNSPRVFTRISSNRDFINSYAVDTIPGCKY